MEVNKQLDKMGYNIGLRLVEDFFAKSGTQRCANLRDTAETISKVGGIPPPARLKTWGYYFRTKDMIDWIQDLPQHYTNRHKLDK